METDLERIKKLGKIREKENYEFRVFLKGWDGPQEKLDKGVRKLYEKYSEKIDCLSCANCCKVLETVLDDHDIIRLATAMDLSVKEFEHQLVQNVQNYGHKRFKEMPCPLLEGNSCKLYKDRPKECASYPYLHKPFFAARLLGVIENYSICPIVYNVFEALKRELWH